MTRKLTLRGLAAMIFTHDCIIYSNTQSNDSNITFDLGREVGIRAKWQLEAKGT